MSNIEVNEYVRTKQGYIAKLIDKDKNCYWFSSYILNQGGFKQYGLDIEKEDRIVNHSKNIIDLIEVGDYVNGYEVITVYGYDEDGNDKDELGICEVDDDYAYYTYLENINIKSIVTKEMFLNAEYKVGE